MLEENTMAIDFKRTKVRAKKNYLKFIGVYPVSRKRILLNYWKMKKNMNC
jgi:hypothetical protein